MTKVRKQAGSVELEHDQVFLMAEDNPNDAELFSEMLNEAFHGQYSVVCVDRFSKIAEALETGKFEALILDMDLPDKSGIDNISHLGEQYPTLPIVVLTGHEDAELAIDSLQCGAQDYLSKNNVTPDVLARSVKYANERKQIERKLKDALQDAAYKNIQLEAQAKHDALTGLANRTYFQESANRVLARAERKNKIVGLLFFDLNEFKKINDTYGHATGDELLKQVSERIGQVIRESDFVARIGGDEFVVITDLMEDKHDIYPLVKRIQNQFDLLFRVGSHDLECTTSIGIAFYPDAPNLDMLMKQADCAMYEAKANIGAHVCFYSEKLDSLYTRSQTIESNLGSAIEKKELIAQFQPVVSASGEHKVYLEALARWHSALLGEVSPDEFIPIAESSPAINGVTQAVTRRVNDLLTVVNDYGLNIDRISINVSAQQLGSQHFCRLFLQWLSELNLPPEYICLELTERQVIQNIKQCRKQFDFLRQQGIQIALDDFGSGFSSITHLLDLPFDILKIDRVLIDHIDTNQRNQALVAGIVEMAHRLDMKVIAEGVEREAERANAIELGCDYLQGFLISKPLVLHEAALFYAQ